MIYHLWSEINKTYYFVYNYLKNSIIKCISYNMITLKYAYGLQPNI
jgi:hypothetical protein